MIMMNHFLTAYGAMTALICVLAISRSITHLALAVVFLVLVLGILYVGFKPWLVEDR